MSQTNAIELDGVCKAYPHFALTDISLTLERGRIMGFIGPNGAGKSTTLRIVMGLVQADRGHVHVLGHRLPEEQVAAKWSTGYASEDARLYGSQTLQWHIDFCRSIYSDWNSTYAETLLQKFDLRVDVALKRLSHGQRVKASLMLVLARQPQLLVLDEPTTGLDPVARSEVLDELLEVLRNEERSILFSSHHVQDVEQLSDQIAFIDRGRIIASKDKETYLDSWRRIRLEIGEATQLPSLPDTFVSHRRGRLATVTTCAFDRSITAAFEDRGATVKGVEHMTLEEIFVAEVKSSRIARGE